MLAQNVQLFYNRHNQIFSDFLRTIIYTLLFEDHQQVWIFQRCLHSSIVMCEGGAQQGAHTSYKVILEIIDLHEADPKRKQEVVQAID